MQPLNGSYLVSIWIQFSFHWWKLMKKNHFIDVEGIVRYALHYCFWSISLNERQIRILCCKCQDKSHIFCSSVCCTRRTPNPEIYLYPPLPLLRMSRSHFFVQIVTQCSEMNEKSIFRFLIFEIWSYKNRKIVTMHNVLKRIFQFF